jgi:phosphatidylethanolamine-binding protein (PEBP) family uncharacterized protein
MTARRVGRVVALVVGALLAAGASGCSTSGRELAAPTQPTLAPAIGSGATTTLEAEEGRGGFALTSPSFTSGGMLPADAGAASGNRSPALQWTNTPEDAAELALVVTDPTGHDVHWLVTGLEATDLIVAAGQAPLGGTVRPNSAGRVGWTGPVPAADGTARVVFRLYALDTPLTVPAGAAATDVVARIAAQSFATATLTAGFAGDGAVLQPN